MNNTNPNRREMLLGSASTLIVGSAAVQAETPKEKPPEKKGEIVIEVEEGGKKKVFTQEDMVGTFRTKYTTAPAPIDPIILLPELEGKARFTVRLHPRLGKPPVESSHIGGMFLWPKAEAWPMCAQHKSALVPILQLRKSDVPELVFRPDTDLFQLLWCPHLHANDDDANTFLRPVAYWRKASELKERLAAAPDPGKVDKELVARPCILHPERVAEYPCGFELTNEQREKLDSPDGKQWMKELNGRIRDELAHSTGPFGMYARWLGAATGTKIGGYPDWIQDPEYPKCKCGAVMSHWMTFQSWEWDAGSYPRWLPIEYNGNRFNRRDEQAAPGWMFGDAGATYLFICRKCKEWPIRSLMQCS